MQTHECFLWISPVYKISWIRRIIPCIGDPRGRHGSATLDPISFIFMQFFGEIWKICMLAPPPSRRVDAICYGESWLRPCCVPRTIVTVAYLQWRIQGAPRRTPPMAQNFLNFMQFFAKLGKIICWLPRGGRGLASPPTGNLGSIPEFQGWKCWPNNRLVSIFHLGFGKSGSATENYIFSTKRMEPNLLLFASILSLTFTSQNLKNNNKKTENINFVTEFQNSRHYPVQRLHLSIAFQLYLHHQL